MPPANLRRFRRVSGHIVAPAASDGLAPSPRGFIAHLAAFACAAAVLSALVRAGLVCI